MEKTLTSSKTFRYFTHGNPEKAKYALYVLHGYGQLASFFIRKFQDLGEEYYIIAPEGMHRFYLNGSSGRVGASWMTKEAREEDITDTQNWLSTLQKEVNSNSSFEKEVVLGFSQGGATAARWNTINSIPNQIYWASIFPPDVAIHNLITNASDSKKYFVLGSNDEYFDETQQKEIFSFYKKNGFKTIEFTGNHVIENKILKKVLSDLHLD